MTPTQSLSKTRFQQQLAFGQMAETAISKWLLSRGASVLPIYDLEYDTGKGPRLFGAESQLAAPDLLVWNDGKCRWIEAKHKSVFSWYDKAKRFETGIDLNHWKDYLKVADRTAMECWLLFLHECSKPDIKDRTRWPDCPDTCPVGLFGNPIDYLQANISHTSDRHGRHGMIYWAYETLKAIAPLSAVLKCESP